MLDKLIGPVAGLLDKFIPDKDAAAALAHEISTMAEKHGQELALAQLSVNKVEASGNWFQSSWRPATAWVCVLGMAINFMVSPLLSPWGVIVPQVDTATMMPVLMGLLGLGSLRTFERTKGISK
jgi:hypothetical protein